MFVTEDSCGLGMGNVEKTHVLPWRFNEMPTCRKIKVVYYIKIRVQQYVTMPARVESMS